MKFVISTAALLLLLGTSVSAYARQSQDQQKQDKPAQQQAKPAQQQHQRQAKPAQQQQQRDAKPAQQQRTQRQHTRQTARSQQPQSRTANRQNNSGRNQSRTQRTQTTRGNGGHSDHGRITNEHYTASFGSEHRFHVNRGDYDHRRFDYGGYSFGFIDPWPMGWGYEDDVYVVYVDGGYYMYDVVHPGLRLSINIL
jgi:hypothetical protein